MASPTSKRTSVRDFQKKLFNSRFFTTSILLHFIFVLAFGGTVLFKQMAETPDFTGGEGTFVTGDSAPDNLPPEMPTEQPPSFEVQAAPETASFEAITTTAITEVKFTVPTITAPTVTPNSDIAQAVSAPPAPTVNSNVGLTAVQAQNIAAFTNSWVRGGKPGYGKNPRDEEFEFTAYLAKYGDPRDRTRGGDWASTNFVKDGKIVRGSLPNLLYFMNKMSRGRIKATPNAVPLDLSSKEIFAKKPPFIFFTGHTDFVLTEQEVQNLREYVQLGGCIWGDSSLPGRRSRFDLAFRREMRRVIPDADKDWEVLPPNHSLYTRNLYYKEITQPPTGINFYKEPVYALKFAGEVAVLYTANDYGDMWQFGLDEKGQFDLGRDEQGQWVAINRTLWDWKNIYIRNIDETSVHNSYKFGTNVVIHLLTRWRDKLRNVPGI